MESHETRTGAMEPYLSSILGMENSIKRKRPTRIKLQMKGTTRREELQTRMDLILPINIVAKGLIHITDVGEDQELSASSEIRHEAVICKIEKKMLKKLKLLIKRRINCLLLLVSFVVNQLKVG